MKSNKERQAGTEVDSDMKMNEQRQADILPNPVLAAVLSKSEAIAAMREGKKVTHEYFSENEWMKLTPTGLYQFEDGCVCTSLLFWQWRAGESWQTGWSVYGS